MDKYEQIRIQIQNNYLNKRSERMEVDEKSEEGEISDDETLKTVPNKTLVNPPAVSNRVQIF